ncbi:hypothetical protein CWATWH0402_322 [Crocosphaera watsonii WH 0402]|uniref:Uncharacterized protein n=1 Tax=Crocosphaera watsonii WH 0402 TaxID=1284629 RepID=T2JPX9_CROWT|nr:hypothetical protein CWATWH0402_322 [Crocosphaera watsonii WH 0402]
MINTYRKYQFCPPRDPPLVPPNPVVNDGVLRGVRGDKFQP